MAKIALFSLFLIVLLQTHFALSKHHEFFPDWKDCDGNYIIEMIDLYLDHQPKSGSPDNMVTFCAGKGKEIKVSEVHLTIKQNNKEILFDQSVPELQNTRFLEGAFQRCLTAGIPEFTEPGTYTLKAEFYHSAFAFPLGCVEAQWEVKNPSSYFFNSYY